jgi:hypothetical protein
MKLLPLALIITLTGCQTQGYQQYADAMARIAESKASVQREQAQAMLRLAEYGADPTTRTVAVLMLAMGSSAGGQAYPTVQPPQNEALQWAQVILPSISTLALGYWGYHLGKTQSNNAADVSIAGYGAMNGIANSGFAAVGQFKPTPIDWTNFPITNRTEINNRDGQVVVGGNLNQDVAVIPPVVVVPPVVVTNP